MNFDSSEFDNFEMPDFSSASLMKEAQQHNQKQETTKYVKTRIVDQGLLKQIDHVKKFYNEFNDIKLEDEDSSPAAKPVVVHGDTEKKVAFTRVKKD